MIDAAIQAVITFISDTHNLLPHIDSQWTSILNGLALLSIGIFISIPIISTKGDVPRDEEENEIITTNKAVILVMIGVVVLFIILQLVDSFYRAAILSGYQAIGVFIIFSTQYIISNTDRNHTILTKFLLFAGIFLIVGELI